MVRAGAVRLGRLEAAEAWVRMTNLTVSPPRS